MEEEMVHKLELQIFGILVWIALIGAVAKPIALAVGIDLNQIQLYP